MRDRRGLFSFRGNFHDSTGPPPSVNQKIENNRDTGAPAMATHRLTVQLPS